MNPRWVLSSNFFLLLTLPVAVLGRLHLINSRCSQQQFDTGKLISSLPAWYEHNYQWTTPIVMTTMPPPTQWYGQYKEDKFAFDTYFYNVTGGTYLELGAFTGKRLSNTLAFQTQLNWKGLLIEANPSNYKELLENRPSDILVHAAVCNQARQVHWLTNEANTSDTQTTATSGILEFMTPEFKSAWHKDPSPDKITKLECVPLKRILQKFGINRIDFFSLDVENAELEVLASIDWHCVQFGLVAIEAWGGEDENSKRFKEVMQEKGYRFLKWAQHSMWFAGPTLQPRSNQLAEPAQ